MYIEYYIKFCVLKLCMYDLHSYIRKPTCAILLKFPHSSKASSTPIFPVLMCFLWFHTPKSLLSDYLVAHLTTSCFYPLSQVSYSSGLPWTFFVVEDDLKLLILLCLPLKFWDDKLMPLTLLMRCWKSTELRASLMLGKHSTKSTIPHTHASIL